MQPVRCTKCNKIVSEEKIANEPGAFPVCVSCAYPNWGKGKIMGYHYNKEKIGTELERKNKMKESMPEDIGLNIDVQKTNSYALIEYARQQSATERAYIYNVLNEVLNFFSEKTDVMKLSKLDLLELVYEAQSKFNY